MGLIQAVCKRLSEMGLNASDWCSFPSCYYPKQLRINSVNPEYKHWSSLKQPLDQNVHWTTKTSFPIIWQDQLSQWHPYAFCLQACATISNDTSSLWHYMASKNPYMIYWDILILYVANSLLQAAYVMGDSDLLASKWLNRASGMQRHNPVSTPLD